MDVKNSKRDSRKTGFVAMDEDSSTTQHSTTKISLTSQNEINLKRKRRGSNGLLPIDDGKDHSSDHEHEPPIFPPNTSLSSKGNAEFGNSKERNEFYLLNEEEADLWTSVTAAKFAAGRYLSTCRQLGLISRTLVTTTTTTTTATNKEKKQVVVPSFFKSCNNKDGNTQHSKSRKRIKLIASSEESTTTTEKEKKKTRKKKPPVIPLPTIAQAKRDVLLTQSNRRKNDSSNSPLPPPDDVDKLARNFQQSWTKIRNRGVYTPSWDPLTGEVYPRSSLSSSSSSSRRVVDDNDEHDNDDNDGMMISCCELYDCMSRKDPFFMDVMEPTSRQTPVGDDSCCDIHSRDSMIPSDILSVLKALIGLMIPHPGLYDQPLVTCMTYLRRLKRDHEVIHPTNRPLYHVHDSRQYYQLKIAIYANRLLFECMTRELQIVMHALDPSSCRVDRPVVIPPSHSLSSDDFRSAEFPKVVIQQDEENPLIQDESRMKKDEEMETLDVDGSTRCTNDTIDAFTIPGLMKLLENTGTFDKTIWEDILAPRLEKMNDSVVGGDSCGLSVELLPHQKHGVCWMHQMERIGNLNHLIWERRRFSEGDFYYYSPSLGQLRLTLSDDRTTRLDGKSFGGGGVLCDEMGLGKTVQTVALIVATLDDMKRKAIIQQTESDGKEDPSTYRHATLIIVPPALLQQWTSEINKIAPWLVVDLLVPVRNSLERMQKPDGDPREATVQVDIVLATYQSLEENAQTRKKSTDTISLHDQTWGRVVLDEMQEIRSWTKRISKLVNNLRSDCRWMLSGTPLLESISDLNGELCFLGLEPFSATNDDGYFQFAVAAPWDSKNPYSLSALKKLAELVMLRRSKSMTIVKTGLPLLGLKPFTLTYEPVPQDDSERALYCFLEFLMHSTLKQECFEEVLEDEKEQAQLEARRHKEYRWNRTAFLRMLREICLSTTLLNGGLGCPSQLDTINRWMKDMNRRLFKRPLKTTELPEDVVPGQPNLNALSCDEAVRFLSQVEDIARTDEDFVTDVRMGGGGGVSNRNRAMESLDERLETGIVEFQRCEDLCAWASSRRAKAYWHLALERVTTGHLFSNDGAWYDRVSVRTRNHWRWRSFLPTLKLFRGWRPTDNFFRQSVSRDSDAAFMALFDRQPRLYWAHPYSIFLDYIPVSTKKVDVEESIVACVKPIRNGCVSSDISVRQLSTPGDTDSWKAVVTFSCKSEYSFFMKAARTAEGITMKCEKVLPWITEEIDDTKKKLEACLAVHRVHPSSLTMSDLAKAKKEHKRACRGLRIFAEERRREGHVSCMKTLGPIRGSAPPTATSLFAATAKEVKETGAILAEQLPLLLRKQRALDQLKMKISDGVHGNISQLTTVEALRALKEGKTDQNFCPICYESLGHDRSLVALTRCGHMSCEECMLHWIEEKERRGERSSCIECRKPVRRDQLVIVDPNKKDEKCSEQQREKAKSLVQEAAAVLDSNRGQLPPHLWEALYLAIDPPAMVSAHNTLTAIPPAVLSHIRCATAMPINCAKKDPGDSREYRLSSKIRALLVDLPRDEASVVFVSSRTAVLHLLSVLKDNQVDCRGLFSGQTEINSKMAISDWQCAKQNLVLVVQAGVAACGLTLTKASKMFVMEPFLRHEEEKQAYARLHRYGQEREVFCKVYYAPVSIEERLLLWRHRYESQDIQLDGDETTIFAPIRGVQFEDEDEDQDQTDHLAQQQTTFLLGLQQTRSSLA